MHWSLVVRAAAKVKEARSALRASSVPALKDRSIAESTETIAIDRLLSSQTRLLVSTRFSLKGNIARTPCRGVVRSLMLFGWDPDEGGLR
jgi:hypothetical protein